MTSIWDTFTREGQEGKGGDFEERALLPEGVYDAVVVRVGEPYDKPNPQSGEMMTKFVCEFELSGRQLKGQTALIPAFLTLTTKFLDSGFLSDKAGVYKVMDALAFDMGSFHFNPPEWVGLGCQVVVKNTKNPDGTQTSWIDSYIRNAEEDAAGGPGPEPEPAPARVPQRQPVAAGRPTTRGKPADDDWTT